MNAPTLNDEIREIRSAADDSRGSDPVLTRKKAMDFLARREHTAEELVGKLVRSGFDREVAGRVVLELTDEGLQDDARLVESVGQSRINQGKGPQRIRADLSQRGVATRIVDHALEAAAVDWLALARSVRERKFGAGPPADYREKARQMRFLQYRGFEAAQISIVFDT